MKKYKAIIYDGFMEVFETFKNNNIKQAIVSAKNNTNNTKLISFQKE